MLAWRFPKINKSHTTTNIQQKNFEEMKQIAASIKQKCLDFLLDCSFMLNFVAEY